jgi:hypothetical protein
VMRVPIISRIPQSVHQINKVEVICIVLLKRWLIISKFALNMLFKPFESVSIWLSLAICVVNALINSFRKHLLESQNSSHLFWNNTTVFWVAGDQN